MEIEFYRGGLDDKWKGYQKYSYSYIESFSELVKFTGKAYYSLDKQLNMEYSMLYAALRGRCIWGSDRTPTIPISSYIAYSYSMSDEKFLLAKSFTDDEDILPMNEYMYKQSSECIDILDKAAGSAAHNMIPTLLVPAYLYNTAANKVRKYNNWRILK